MQRIVALPYANIAYANVDVRMRYVVGGIRRGFDDSVHGICRGVGGGLGRIDGAAVDLAPDNGELIDADGSGDYSLPPKSGGPASLQGLSAALMMAT
jgi:hypothetical protein